MFMFDVSCACSHAFPGRYARACSLIRFISKNPDREECVSPAECPAGTVQSSPPDTPMSMSPALVSLIAPHASLIRMNGPDRFVAIDPVMHAGTMPPCVVTTVGELDVTFANGIGQPACSIPSGGLWSLLSG